MKVKEMSIGMEELDYNHPRPPPSSPHSTLHHHHHQYHHQTDHRHHHHRPLHHQYHQQQQLLQQQYHHTSPSFSSHADPASTTPFHHHSHPQQSDYQEIYGSSSSSGTIGNSDGSSSSSGGGNVIGGASYYTNYEGVRSFFGDDSGRRNAYHSHVGTLPNSSSSFPPPSAASLTSLPHLRHHHHSRNHGITSNTSPLFHLRSNLNNRNESWSGGSSSSSGAFGENETFSRRNPSLATADPLMDNFAEMSVDHPNLVNSTSSSFSSPWTKFSEEGKSAAIMAQRNMSASYNKTLSPVAAAFEQFVNSSEETIHHHMNSTPNNYANMNDADNLIGFDDFSNGSSFDGGSGVASGTGFPNEFFNLSSSINESVSAVGGGGGGESTSIRGNLYASIVPVMLFFCVLAVLVNLLIVISARWCRRPMSPTLYFSISLALADAYAAFILATGLVINSLLPFVFSYSGVPVCLSLVVEAFRQGGVLVTVSHLLALAMNHWIGIVRPLHYAATMTRRTAWIVIIWSWICPITIIFIYYSSIPGEGFQSPACDNYKFLKERAYRAFFASCFFAPLILMSFIYIHIFIIVRNHHTHRQRFQSTQQLKRNVKAVLTTMLVLGTYIIGWMPATLFSLIACDDCIYKMESLSIAVRYSMGFTTNLLVILKTLVDPVIYAARMSDIQMALKKMRYDILSKFCKSCAPAAPPTPNDRGSFYETKSMRMSSFGTRSTTQNQRTRMLANNAAAVAANASLLHHHTTTNNHHLQLNHRHNYNHNNQQAHKPQLNNGIGCGSGGGNTNGYGPYVTSASRNSGIGGGNNEISRSFLQNTQQPLYGSKTSFEMSEMNSNVLI